MLILNDNECETLTLVLEDVVEEGAAGTELEQHAHLLLSRGGFS